ncbi:MAG: hypothetical protein Ct9H300mP16_01380 [Pseudomonadota bacterium]|nr:MAG: hypothetical protein Ct9H300mP16_01380 [Pseudomonadota bacterium]
MVSTDTRVQLPDARRCVLRVPEYHGTGLDARALQGRLLEEAGVATVAGTSFGRMGEGFIRFSYANGVDNIQDALERIQTLLEA